MSRCVSPRGLCVSCTLDDTYDGPHIRGYGSRVKGFSLCVCWCATRVTVCLCVRWIVVGGRYMCLGLSEKCVCVRGSSPCVRLGRTVNQFKVWVHCGSGVLV